MPDPVTPPDPAPAADPSLDLDIGTDPAPPIIDDSPPSPDPAAPPADPKPADEAPAWFSDFKKDLDSRFDTMQEQINSTVKPEADPAPADPTPTPDPSPREAPKTMEELDQYVDERAEAKLKAKEEADQKAADEARKKEEETQKQVDQYLDEQVNSLVKDNLLPARKEGEKNPYHASLYSYAAFLQTDNLVRVGQVLKDYHDKGQVFDLKASNEKGTPVFHQVGPAQAGGTAPVGTSAASTGTPQGQPDYKTIHQARDLDELIARADTLLPEEQ